MHSQWNVTIAAHGMWHILMKWAPSSQHGSQWQMFIKQRKEKAKPWNPYKPRADFSPLHFQSDKCSKPPRGHSSSNPVGRKEGRVCSEPHPSQHTSEWNKFISSAREKASEQARSCISGNTPVFCKGILELLYLAFSSNAAKKGK